MGTKKDGSGWVNPGKKDIPCQACSDAPTRVAQMDWLEDESAGSTSPSNDIGADATALTFKSEDANDPPSRRSAQYIPAAGMRKTGEVTALWTPKHTFQFSRVPEIIESIRATVTSRRALLLFIGCLFAASGIMAHTFFEPEKASLNVKQGAMSFRADSGEGETLNAGEGLMSPREGSNNTVDNLEPPTLKAAADALVAGRLDEALKIYQRLALAFPKDESFALAAEILLRGKGSE